jgi:hypothetical protein
MKLLVALGLLVLSSCTCQRQENIEAKARLSKPAPPDPHVKAADDRIDVDKLDDPEVMKRVTRMTGQEIAARLRSFSFKGDGELVFRRGESGGVRSGEHTRVVQGLPRADGTEGDFAVEVITGDGSEQRLAFVNDVFFLKNNNGRWRMSRDPDGERNHYRTDSLAIWRSFYDLFSHALRVERLGAGTADGRPVVKYRLVVADKSAEATALGAQEPPPPVGPDGGPAEESAADKRKRMRDRMSKWRERARAAGGSGELSIDEKSGVITMVRFAGSLFVGDGPTPARLDVKIDQSYSEIGRDHQIPMPKDAIEEIVRTKMPVRPRELLEEEGIVDPLSPDAGPYASGPRKGKKKPAAPVEPPDDND